MFVGHANIWPFTTGYSIDPLADLICAKWADKLAHWSISEPAFIVEIGGLVHYVCRDRTTAEFGGGGSWLNSQLM